MSTLSADKKPLVDYGVQIRFIKDLHDTGGGYPDKSRSYGGAAAAATPSNKYGVAVRVQGISGHPYVVLKDGEKGDSYGVQLNSPNPTSGPPSPASSLTRLNKEPAEFSNPYSPAASTTPSPASLVEEEVEDGDIFGSPLRRPPGDGQAGTQAEEEGEPARGGRANKSKTEPQAKAAAKDLLHQEEYNEAGLKPVRLNGLDPSRGKSAGPGATASLGRKVKMSTAQREPPASTEDEPGSPVDTNSLTPVNKLISKFNSGTPGSGTPGSGTSSSGTSGSGTQTRGRSGARQRLSFDERRRSRSLDARKDAETSASRTSPPTLNPYAAPLCASSASSTSSASAMAGSLAKSPASVSTATATASEAPRQSFTFPGRFEEKDTAVAVMRKPVIPPRTMTPTSAVINNEESQMKQAIFNILKDGTADSESFLRRKVDLIYETTTNHRVGLRAEAPRFHWTFPFFL